MRLRAKQLTALGVAIATLSGCQSLNNGLDSVSSTVREVGAKHGTLILCGVGAVGGAVLGAKLSDKEHANQGALIGGLLGTATGCFAGSVWQSKMQALSQIARDEHLAIEVQTLTLEAPVGKTDGQTLIVVGKAAAPIPAGASTTGDASTPFYVGNYRGASVTEGVAGTAYGTSLYHVQSATFTGGGARANDTGGATSAVTSLGAGEVPTEWGLRVMRTSSAMATKVQNLTRNTMVQGTDLRARALADSVFQIGSGTAAFGGEVDISAVAIFSRAITDAELNEVAAAMRKRMQRLGINV